SVLRQCSAAIGVTSYLCDALCARGMAPERVALIPNGVDPERFRPEIDGSEVRRRRGIGDRDCVVGFCGAMSSWYRLPEVVSEFAAAFARMPHMRLLLIGDGPDCEAVRQRIAGLGCGEQIVLVPRVAHDDVPRHLA